MRTLGFVQVVFLSIFAFGCGSADEDAGLNGSGGSAGTAGSAGAGAIGGSGGSGGAAGNGGAAGSGGAAGAAGAPTGTVANVDCATATAPINVTMTGTIGNFAFDPAEVTVPVGGVVKWINGSASPHTTTSGTPGAPDGKWDSGTLLHNAAYCVKFDAAGSYDYFCSLHPTMLGKVTAK